MKNSIFPKLVAEFLGTTFLLMAIVGSGLMATKLTEDDALQLLINALAAVLMLSVIIPIFNASSGAHFNPVVTLLKRLNGSITTPLTCLYVFVQILGAITGTVISNLMFGTSAFQLSSTNRISAATFLGEVVATSGLLLLILLGPNRAHFLVPAWIGSAYFFTSSTSFANPAVTIGRVFTNSYSGITPGSLSGFIAAQVLSIPIVYFLYKLIFNEVKH